ncbi:MAG TPA: aldehyde ferredoxin oxidoreductase family protein [Syntrophomonadaceae bacterium]|nr:aldehyde ferredoxin oxidoreductase family protein [Syntrophomonadaceae bacterium]HRX20522.1 aldehyde ferredoxin oxidoreductase family protein [Syntrophomonadaceae bacterium]
MILPRYLEIDLTTEAIRTYSISEADYDMFISGKALAAKILYDELPPFTPPLSPENIIVINTGILTGSGAPSSSRFNISTKSPLTGAIASSNCGGIFGTRLRRAGYDGLVIRGKASRPVYIEIIDGKVQIKDAADIWGLNSEESQARFDKKYGKLVIGPAGENGVLYACAVSGERVAGRCGTGAVMGSKNLKALVAQGNIPIPIADETAWKDYIGRWMKFLKEHPSTGQDMPGLGTAGFVNKANRSRVLPVHNFSEVGSPLANQISGETLAADYLEKNSGCLSCPIRCERRVKLNGKDIKGPEYETIGLFGSNIGNFDLQSIINWNYQADLLGMDTISLAGTLAFAMELQQKGIKDFGIRFDSPEGIREAIDDIACRRGVCAELADGSARLAQKYGEKSCAIQVKGLELASYDPRHTVGLGLGYATANRGACHLGGGFLTFLEVLSPVTFDGLTTRGKAALTVFFQNAMEAISLGGSCLFTSFTVMPAFLFGRREDDLLGKVAGRLIFLSNPVIKFLAKHPSLLHFKSFALFPHVGAWEIVTGRKISTGDFIRAGERAFVIERMFNMREGFSSNDDVLPDRLMEELTPDQDVKLKDKLAVMLAEYYRIRRYDRQGKPGGQLLKELGLSELPVH